MTAAHGHTVAALYRRDNWPWQGSSALIERFHTASTPTNGFCLISKMQG